MGSDVVIGDLTEQQARIAEEEHAPEPLTEAEREDIHSRMQALVPIKLAPFRKDS